MSYTPKTWVDGEVIYHQDLNHMEQGIQSANSGLLTKQDKLSNTNAGNGITIQIVGGVLKISNSITIDTNNNTLSFGGKTFVLQEYVPTSDYYIGWWANGSDSSFEEFEALDGSQLTAVASGHMKSQTSITKTVVASDVIGSRQIFFIMWKEDSAPQGGIFYGGISPETLNAASFLDENVFNAQRDDVTINGTVYHVAGMRSAFEYGNYFTINF